MYLCLFQCMKAVHLELVTDLTSDAFIACLRRFIARRGLPNLIWSENGTNFVGACRQLREVQDSISKFLTSKNVEWKFIPQHAPHFGGLWEAAVKSTKTHLYKILGKLTMKKCPPFYLRLKPVSIVDLLCHWIMKMTVLRHLHLDNFSLANHSKLSQTHH